MQHSETIAIDTPVSSVWNLVGNPANWSRWMDGLTDLRVEGDLAPGSPVSYNWRGKPRRSTITRYVHDQEIALKGEEPNYSYSESITVRGMGSTTNVSMEMSIESSAWWAMPLAPVAFAFKKLFLGMPMRKSLKALKSEAEGVQLQQAA